MFYKNQFKDLFEFVGVNDGLEALESVTSNPRDHFDLIVLDINMPVMDGFEACLNIGKHFAKLDEDVLFFKKHSRTKSSRDEFQGVLGTSEKRFKSDPLSKPSAKRNCPLMYALSADHSPELKNQI